MDTTIFLIRHGGVENPEKLIYGRGDVPLTEKGKKQVQKLAQKLKKQGVKPDLILTSPMLRTQQTAQELQKCFINTPVIIKKDLEETDMGKLTGKPLYLLLTVMDFYRAKKFQNLNIEKPEQIVQRMLNVILMIKQKEKGKTIFVVSHGDPLAFLLWKLINPTKPPPSRLKLLSSNYLKLAQAWKVILGEKTNFLDSTISP